MQFNEQPSLTWKIPDVLDFASKKEKTLSKRVPYHTGESAFDATLH